LLVVFEIVESPGRNIYIAVFRACNTFSNLNNCKLLQLISQFKAERRFFLPDSFISYKNAWIEYIFITI